ncbi:MAG: HAMP domain-containing histidine kinase, partial [Candidatus Taylorbacteria bacterium]|nr:HAMP domain-containing histidine kinase [Candidatus Taylorbacteria bacterium]
ASDLQKTNTRLEELNIQKTEFVSFATHQLRSPLTAMKGYASLILEGDMGAVTPETKQAVERIFDSSKTLTNVVDNYLNISRIELGTMKYFISTLDMKKLVEELIGEIKPNITTAGLEINFTADAKETYMIEADADKFKQVIANLIDNSIKYTPKGKIDVTIDKNLKTHKILFSLKDTGIGMSDKTLPKLFKKFSRSDKASETNIRGTGLGLYLAKEIVAAHKGKIWATSDGENKGSHFFVEMDAK